MEHLPLTPLLKIQYDCLIYQFHCEFTKLRSFLTLSSKITFVIASETKRSELARELPVTVWKKNNCISWKRSLSEIWFIEEKNVCFHPETHFRHEPTKPWGFYNFYISETIIDRKKYYKQWKLTNLINWDLSKFQNDPLDSFQDISLIMM